MFQRLYLLPLLFLFFISCSRVTYVPTMVTTPMLHEKNDMRISVTSDDAQFAYAVSDRWAVAVNGQVTTRWLQRLREGDYTAPTDLYPQSGYRFGYNQDDETRGGQLEIGAGYNVPFKSPGGKTWRLEFFGGYSYGAYRTMDSNFTPSYESRLDKSWYQISNRFHRAYVQTSMSWEREKSEMILTWRTSLVNFHKLYSAPLAWENQPQNRDRFHRLDGRMYPIMEPAFTHRIGRRHFQFFYQVRFAFHPRYFNGMDDLPERGYMLKSPPETLQAGGVIAGISYRTGKWIPPRKHKRIFPWQK